MFRQYAMLDMVQFTQITETMLVLAEGGNQAEFIKPQSRAYQASKQAVVRRGRGRGDRQGVAISENEDYSLWIAQ